MFKSAIKLLRKLLPGTTVDNVRECMRKVARFRAESAYHADLALYYDGVARSIDPNQDWWRFADNKQRWADHVKERDFELQRARAAQAKLEATQKRLAAILEAR